MPSKAKLRVTSHIEITTKIAGVTHDDPSTGMNRQALIKKHVRVGMQLTPAVEPDNPHDPNAVGLWYRARFGLFMRDVHLGYIGRTHSAYVAEKLRAGNRVTVTVSQVTGGSKDKPTMGVNVVIRW